MSPQTDRRRRKTDWYRCQLLAWYPNPYLQEHFPNLHARIGRLLHDDAATPADHRRLCLELDRWLRRPPPSPKRRRRAPHAPTELTVFRRR
jgi:hypothetical protein